MTTQYSGAWDAREVAHFLGSALFPMRLSCVGADGFPRVISLWYLYSDDCIYAVSHESSHLVTLLRASDKVGFEIAPNEPPYKGVRGQGTVSLTADDEGAMLTRLLDRFIGDTQPQLRTWLLSRADGEMLLRIEPHRMFSWDYSSRMSG